jgi:hypothetical protein
MLFNRDNLTVGVLIFLIIAVFFISIDYLTVQKSAITGRAGGGGGTCGDVAWEYCSEDFAIRCSGSDPVYPAGGECLGPQLCCRQYPYCGDFIYDGGAGGEQCDGLLNLATCESAGYYNGTTSCTGSCTEDFTACHNCGNGVCDVGETCSGCLTDCEGNQSDCSAGQVCADVMGSGTCVAAAPTVCNDTTSVNSCSSVSGAPWYCLANGSLAQNCTACGCESGSTCDVDGMGCTEDIPERAPSYAGRTFSVTDATAISPSVPSSIHSMDAVVSGTQLSWDGIRRRDKISFEVTSSETSSGNAETESHTFEVVSVSRARKSVKAVFYSDPINVVLYEGESQRVDLDGDGIEDVVALATNIGLTTFDIDIQEIDKEKLQEEESDSLIVKIRERRVFFPEPLLSPVFEESPEANLYEFIIVNSLIILSMVFFFFRFAKEIKKK